MVSCLSYVTEEELQEVIDAWEEDWSEGVENLGWELDDTEVYFHGELSLEQVVEN